MMMLVMLRRTFPGTFPGTMSCVEKKFELHVRKWEEYRDTRYYDGDSALVVELWLYRVADDLWKSADFHLAEVRPLQLDSVARGDRRTFGEAERNLQAMGTCMFVLSMENDNDFRSQCE
jgi:hypothetical protein